MRIRVARQAQARLFGVLGEPVEHSLSPTMHNAAFAAAGLPHLYLRYRVPPDRLRPALDEARTLGMGGLNLTVPLKEAVLPLLDAVSPEAGRVGAVNTVLFRDGRLIGDNTDARGFARSLRGHVRLPGAAAVVIGAGGSARAVGAALVAGGVRRIVVANRTAARAEALVARLRALGTPDVRPAPLTALLRSDVLADAALVVNTTSTGLHGAAVRVRHAATPRGCLYVDLVYGDRPTPFLAAAARAGRPTLDGTGMLLHQGALAWEAWNRRPAPLGAMARALADAGLALTRLGTAGTFGAPRPAHA